MKQLVKLNLIDELDFFVAHGNGLINVILGPRQVGKTTTLLKYLEDHYQDRADYYNADQVFNSQAQWLLEICLKAQKNKKMLVIDEIQKCENWAEVIKKNYDQFKREKKDFSCALLGSSSLQIQKGLSKSLTGRFKLIPAYHWNFSESKKGYDLTFSEYLKFGGYPGAYQFIGSKDWIDYVKNSIIATVIEKDILQYNKVKSPALFKQAFLIKALAKFSTNTIKTKTSSPENLPLAPCLYYLTILDEYSAEEMGRVFELLVGAQLVRTGEQIYYWREGNLEVDFVLKRGKKIGPLKLRAAEKKS